MRYKYMITRNDAENKLNIKEFSELDKELFSLVCEETHDAKSIKKAIKTGRQKLIGALRTPNMYPVEAGAEKIAEAVTALYKSSAKESVEVLYEDVQHGVLPTMRVEREIIPMEPLPVDVVVDVELDEDDEIPQVDEFIDTETDEKD